MLDSQFKLCKCCKVKKPTLDFYSSPRTKDTLDCWCKSCRAAQHAKNWRKPDFQNRVRKSRQARDLRVRYNLTPEDKEAIFRAQKESCAICHRHLSLGGGVSFDRVCIDYNGVACCSM
jgi:hypothetical protein